MGRRPRPRNSLSEPDIRSVPVIIYGLAEPDSAEIRYVGKSQNPRARLTSHSSRSGSMRLFHWIATLAKAGKRPVIVTLRVVPPGEDACAAELDEIRRREAAGNRLINFFGTLNRPKKLDSRRPSEIIRECAAMGHGYCQRRVAKWRHANA